MQENYVVANNKEIHYIDVVTRGINQANSGITGQLNNFVVNTRLSLDASKNYNVKVIVFNYKNITSPANISPIILTDFSDTINVNGNSSSIIYKSSVLTGNSNFIQTDETNNVNLIRQVKRTQLTDIYFQIVRSDNGLPFPFDENDPQQQINIMLKIETV